MAAHDSGLLCKVSLTKQLFLSKAVVMALQASSVILLLLMENVFNLLLSFNVLNRAMAALDD